MTGLTKVCWWGLAVVGAVVAVGSVAWVSAADLERSSQVSGVVGSVVAVAALGVALWQLRTTNPPPGPAPTPSAPESVRVRDGSVAGRGNIRNARARDTAPGTPSGTPAAGGPGISASGGSIAAGGDIDGASAHHGP
ncbi:hypothetical protein ACWGR4_28925 [Embleya sp. NPDC055664]